MGGSRNGGQELTIQGIHAAMLIHGMVVVGDNSHFGGIANDPSEVDKTGMQTVENTVHTVIETLKRLK